MLVPVEEDPLPGEVLEQAPDRAMAAKVTIDAFAAKPTVRTVGDDVDVTDLLLASPFFASLLFSIGDVEQGRDVGEHLGDVHRPSVEGAAPDEALEVAALDRDAAEATGPAAVAAGTVSYKEPVPGFDPDQLEDLLELALP